MNCDFIKDLSKEQRDQLRKLLDETPLPIPVPQYRVAVGFWDRDKTKIMCLLEYLGDQLHGVSIEWCRNGQIWYEHYYQNGKPHGVWKGWFQDGQLQYEHYYQNGQLVK